MTFLIKANLNKKENVNQANKTQKIQNKTYLRRKLIKNLKEQQV